MVLHLVRTREFLAAYRAGKHLALMTLVIEKRMPLETVLVLEGLLYVELRTFGALINTLVDGSVTEEI